MFILQITTGPATQTGTAIDDIIDKAYKGQPSPTPPRTTPTTPTRSIDEVIDNVYNERTDSPTTHRDGDSYVSSGNGRLGPTIIQAAAPVAVASRHALSTGVLAESWASLRATGSVANPHIAGKFINITRLENAYNGLANTRLGRIPYIGNSLSRAFGWTSRLFTSGSLNYGVRAAGLLEKIPRYGLPITRGLGFIGGRALPVLGAGIAVFDCGRDIFRCFNPPQGQSRGVAIANAAVNVGCTATGAVIGGIIGSCVPVVGTFIGACIGAGIGNLVGNVVKSAITPGGLLNRFGRWLFGA